MWVHSTTSFEPVPRTPSRCFSSLLYYSSFFVCFACLCRVGLATHGRSHCGGRCQAWPRRRPEEPVRGLLSITLRCGCEEGSILRDHPGRWHFIGCVLLLSCSLLGRAEPAESPLPHIFRVIHEICTVPHCLWGSSRAWPAHFPIAYRCSLASLVNSLFCRLPGLPVSPRSHFAFQ